MPRRLDPKAGMPGLFARGRAKESELDFLVRPDRSKRKKSLPDTDTVAVAVTVTDTDTVAVTATEAVTATDTVAAPAARAPLATTPDTFFRDAPPARRVRELEDRPLGVGSLGAIALCTFGWARSYVRSAVATRLARVQNDWIKLLRGA